MATSKGYRPRKMSKGELRRYGTGRVIADRYEIVDVVGAGAMAVVWLARDRKGESLFWAIKEMRPNTFSRDRDNNLNAMLAEAYFIQRLDNPAIPRVTEIIKTGSTKADFDVFVVMDYVDGEPPRERMKRQGHPFSQEEVIDWGIQLCDVLGYLHRGHRHVDTDSRSTAKADFYPIVYRDLKPDNVMLCSDGTVKLVDFGIAMELKPGGKDAFGGGTMGYSAPEQLDREAHGRYPADTRADIYALGTTLYSLVTGYVPKVVANRDGSRAVDFSMRPIREVDPTLSDGLERIIWKATRPNPDDRYQDVEDMRYDLEHYEDLTQEHRSVQQHKVDTFCRRLVRAVLCAALGAACVVASFAVRGTSYGSLIARARSASTDEANVSWSQNSQGVMMRTAEPSDAERLYTQAIEVNPGGYEAYAGLVESYEADGLFTPTEERRWRSVWEQHGDSMRNKGDYGRLCYDVGVAYLCYYDYMGLKDKPDSSFDVGAISGQGSIENATRSSEWFRRANEAYRNDAGTSGLSDREYAATQVYETIAAFHTTFSKGSLEGKSGDLQEAYVRLWESLRKVVLGDGGDAIVSQSDDMVKLRLYQVAFEAISSPTYLAGFRDNTAVTQDAAEQLLDAVGDGTANLADFVSSMSTTGDSTSPAQAIYDEMADGRQEAEQNIKTTFNSPAAIAAQGNADKASEADGGPGADEGSDQR